MVATKTADLIEFAVTMAQEFNLVDNLASKLDELLRLARRHGKLQERACNQQVKEGHDAKCEAAIRKLCRDISPNLDVMFSGDPRGYTVKLILPSKRSNNWGGTGWGVPQ